MTCAHVCVWTICTDVKLPLFESWLFFAFFRFGIILAGGQCTTDRHCPTKTLSVRGDTEPDQLCVPASFFFSFL